jgi:alginate O-acetyltransferase complex protein AlgI
MTLSSLEFPFFLLLVLVLRWCSRTYAAELMVLLGASYVFYMSWSVPAVLLLITIAVIDYHVARAVAATEDFDRRTRLLRVSIISNVGMLGVFKYTNFIIENLLGIASVFGLRAPAVHYDIALPPGISYFTFAGIAYVVDVYYERMAPCQRANEYLLYIAFFPKVLAGPIARATEFLPQLRDRVRASAHDVEVGLTYFALGAVKKVVISDQIAPNVNVIFATPGQFDALTLIQGVLGYTVQIYCDFSGYSDMAIGCARLMGFRFPDNFRMPYSASSITEFWRRWHITLSSWFRDYVFLPLEISTRGTARPALQASVNLMITMLLCGLWHGASWTFVIWGGLHGAALAVERVWTGRTIATGAGRSRALEFASTLASRGMTLTVVMVGWVFFRAPSLGVAGQYLTRIVSWQGGIRLISPYILPAVAIVAVVHLLVNKDRNWAEELPAYPMPVRIGAFSSLVLLLTLLGAADAAPFIYFKF